MEHLDLSIPFQRLIGFTVPENDRFLICDHDEVWEIVVGSSVIAKETDHAPYEIAERNDFVGWGRSNAAPVLEFGQRVISYEFDPEAPTLHLHYRDGFEEEQIEFPILSGDWFSASLSRDGRLLVLADPYQISLYRTST